MTMLLDARAQSAVRRLLMAEPEPGTLVPRDALDALMDLIGSNCFWFTETDRTGWRLRGHQFPAGDDIEDPKVCDGPLPTGLLHAAELPPDKAHHGGPAEKDELWLGFAISRGTVVQLNYARRDRYFSQRDIDVLTMLEPALARLVRGSAGRETLPTLTPAERRVLTLVSRGASNREAAEDLYLSVHTVRKHLENAYRKLGVSNRTAAVLMTVHADR